MSKDCPHKLLWSWWLEAKELILTRPDIRSLRARRTELPSETLKKIVFLLFSYPVAMGTSSICLHCSTLCLWNLLLSLCLTWGHLSLHLEPTEIPKKWYHLHILNLFTSVKDFPNKITLESSGIQRQICLKSLSFNLPHPLKNFRYESQHRVNNCIALKRGCSMTLWKNNFQFCKRQNHFKFK